MNATGWVGEDGKLRLDDREGFLARVEEFAGKRVTVSVESVSGKHSDATRRYWWGVIVPFFQLIWTRERRLPLGLPGYTKDDAHEVLVQISLGFEDGPHGTRVRKKTRDLSQQDYSKLIEDAKSMAWHDYQAVIPDPSEPVDGL